MGVFIGVHATWAKDKDGVLFSGTSCTILNVWTLLYQMFGSMVSSDVRLYDIKRSSLGL